MSEKVEEKSISGKPLQFVSYSEKKKNEFKVMTDTADYYIRNAVFNTTPVSTGRNLGEYTKKQIYDAYNNVIPTELFSSVLNPLNNQDEKYKKFPAEPRPYNILRPNIDLLIGEWNKRIFQYDVVNADGNDAFSEFLMARDKAFNDNATQRFVNDYTSLHEGDEVALKAIPDPQELFSEFNVTYKDAKALKGVRALKVMELELFLREKWRKLFKDWLLGGDVYTFKTPIHDKIEYKALSTLAISVDISENNPYAEDGEYACAYFRASVSDVLDLFYDVIEEKKLKGLEKGSLSYSSPTFNILTNGITKGITSNKEVDLYYTCWKSKQKKGFLSYPDPFSGEIQHDIVDEDYVVQKEFGETVEWFWGNQVWNDWRINDDYHVLTEPIEVQRTEINNFSSCKLPINGKRFSDTESANVSVGMLGMPYQVLYIILMYRLELTIAKSKGKIMLLDRNVIPDDEDLDEAGFFWYADAMGFALIEPNAGSAYNQYTVHDMSLFDHIKELIGIIDYVKSQWDELLGITRQRKGQTAASDGLGVTEQAIFRSSVISDLIFTGFEDFLEKELAGLLDASKFAWIDGKTSGYRNDDGRMEMLQLDGEDHASTSYGVFVQNMSALLDKFNAIKQNVNAIAQRKEVKVSTIIDMIATDSLTELKALVKKAEYTEQKIIEQTAANEADRVQEQEEAKQKWALFMNSLEIDRMERDHDRLDNREYIKASLDKDPGAGVDPYISVVEQEATKRLDTMTKAREGQQKIDIEKEKNQIAREKIAADERKNIRDNKTKIKNKVAGEK